MNVELLQQIKAQILAEPDAFRMDMWTCGTAHCIAGWALKLAQNPIVNPDAAAFLQMTATGEVPHEAAARVLGLSTDSDYEDSDGGWPDDSATEAGRLFHVNNWPAAFEHRYRESQDRAERAQIATERIDYFIATEGCE